MMDEPRQAPDGSMDLSRLAAFWRGDVGDEYGEAAVVGTLAIALRTLGDADDAGGAESKARRMWDARARKRLLAAA